MLGDARKQGNRDLNGFGAAFKEDYIHGGENRSGPFWHAFLFFSFFLFFFPKKRGGWGRAARQGKRDKFSQEIK